VAINLPVERDLTLIFERDDVREVVASHCASTHDAERVDKCPYCLRLITIIAMAVSEWLVMVDQDRAAPTPEPDA
jgi:hypothetical protein